MLIKKSDALYASGKCCYMYFLGCYAYDKCHFKSVFKKDIINISCFGNLIRTVFCNFHNILENIFKN